MTQITVAAEPSRFPLGNIYVTPAAEEAIPPGNIALALRSHAQGDWGDVCDEDRAENERALAGGGRLISVYHSRHGTFWVITEHNRSATTVLLPDDY